MDIIASIIIIPTKAVFELLFTFSYSITHSYGTALILLSVFTSVLMHPLVKRSNVYVNKEKIIQSILAPQISYINSLYKGKEKNSALFRLYKRYSYSPIYSIRLSFNVLIQLPLLFGAYCFLSTCPDIKNVPFLWVKDLSVSDGLLYGVNVLPFVMTFVNISVAFITPNFSRKDFLQSFVIALLFLFILYSASSSLLIYWTCNNIISLLNVLYLKNNIYLYTFFNKICFRFFNNALKDYNSDSWKYLIVMSSLTPAGLLWFMNIEFFGIVAICKSVFILLMISLLIILVLGGVRKLIGFIQLKVIFVSLLLVLSSSLFYGASKKIFQETNIFLLLAFFYCLIFLLGRIRLINFILVAQFVLVSLIGIVNHVSSEYSSSKDITANQINSSIKLNSTPNIYYILCESMVSFDIIQKIYGFSQNELLDFKSFMTDRGFVLYDDIYANGEETLNTLYYLSLMNTTSSKSVGILDISISKRRVISGNTDNNLLRILKFNGYHISHLLQGSNYYYDHKGELVDFSDIFPVYSQEDDPIMYLQGIMRYIEANYLYNKIYYRKKNTPSISRESLDAISWYFSQNFANPRFLLQRMSYTDHTDSDGKYSYKNANDWIKSNWYQNAYKKQLNTIKKETDFILKNDPNAIIIYLGDHGSWLYRAYPNNKDELNKVLHDANISEKLFFDDKFKVFAAIRFPKGISKIDAPFSSANIFSKLFNKIGIEDGRKIPEAPNDSYFLGKRVIKDSKLVGFDK